MLLNIKQICSHHLTLNFVKHNIIVKVTAKTTERL